MTFTVPLTAIFGFWAEFDQDFRTMDFSPATAKLIPTIKRGAVADVAITLGSSTRAVDWSELRENKDANRPALHVNGVRVDAHVYAGESSIALVMHPWTRQLSDLVDLGLSLADFPVGSPMLDLMMVQETLFLERAAREMAVHSQEQLAKKLEFVVELTDAIYGVLSEDLVVESSNADAHGLWLGLLAPVTGSHFTDLVCPEDRTGAQQSFTQLVPNGPACRLRLRVGADMWADVTLACQSLASRKSYVFVLKDVTADVQHAGLLERALRDAAQAQNTMNSFMANMSHELRTPLNAIIGLSETLEEQIIGTLVPDQVECVSTIRSSGHHLLALLNDVLTVAKENAGQGEIFLEPIDFADTVRASVRLIAEAAKRQSQTIVTLIPPSPIDIVSDHRRILQILVNLIGNASKFSPPGSQITVTVGVERPCAVFVSVRDAGIGIPEHERERIFERFYQIDPGAARHYEGTGLGLALAKQFATSLGGSITVEGHEGPGTTFTLALPVGPVGNADPD
ncbi:MAG: HAMP domain-containing sensor histidine kinase [Gemmatimonadota bacterium]|nr:HAMP domain-containing sensor histidine kinase [Gemmatimonadota bacterium]